MVPVLSLAAVGERPVSRPSCPRAHLSLGMLPDGPSVAGSPPSVHVRQAPMFQIPFRIPFRSVPLSSRTPPFPSVPLCSVPFHSVPFHSGTRSVRSVPFRHVGVFRREAHRWVRLTSGNIFCKECSRVHVSYVAIVVLPLSFHVPAVACIRN